jgi:hypothetical protein
MYITNLVHLLVVTIQWGSKNIQWVAEKKNVWRRVRYEVWIWEYGMARLRGAMSQTPTQLISGGREDIKN